MGKRGKTTQDNDNGPDLFSASDSRRRSGLILRRFLADEAEKFPYRGEQQERAHKILARWADLETEGHLTKKETALDADFLREVFGEALGYKTATEGPDDYQLQRNFTVPGIGVADGALGNFRTGAEGSPLVVIKLKAASVNLDKDKFNGRTPVQQCWDYLDGLPNCPWGIVSNFVTLRLYHRDKTPLAYEEFRLQDLHDLRKFRQFYCLFDRGGLIRPLPGRTLRALDLLQRTENRQREVGDKLYAAYSVERARLIEHLCSEKNKSLDRAIRVAQKILDRIIFVAFCEDRELLPAKCIDRAYSTLPPFSKVTNPRWRNFLDLFHAVDRGHPDFGLTTGFDGGLFAHDPEVDDLQLDDQWTNFFRHVGTYDFRDEVNVDVLGHLFEKSVAELEKMRVGGLFAVQTAATPSAMRKSAQRKRFGTYYTPPDFTRFIVRRTVAEVIDRRIEEVRRRHKLETADTRSDGPSPKLAGYWRDCAEAVRGVKICDPACGSGAFLVQAYEVLEERYRQIVDELAHHDGLADDEMEDAIPGMILADNLHGVDVSAQAVEITQLALWIRSARRNKTLADLSENIVLGNSIVTDAVVHPQALDWETRFPNVFSRPENPGFGSPAFRKSSPDQDFAPKQLQGRQLGQSGCSRLFPVVPGCGGRQPGQIRDKFRSPFRPNDIPPGPPSPRREQPPCVPVTIPHTRGCCRRRDGSEAGAGDEPPTPDDENRSDLDEPLPRPKRRRRRAKADRGLPPDEELAKLAVAYCERQRKHWPKLVEAGLLPKPTDPVIRRMVEDFKTRHQTGRVDVEGVRPFVKCAKLAGSYSRFSCDNSDPTSALDQMVNALDKARHEDRFVPWAYVFCDYSVTGLDPSRQGYISYKSVLDDENHFIETTYIDDFTRASRDEIEWWKLAALSKRLNKRLIGTSDGFDLSNPNSDILITTFGLVSRLFIRGLREKVRRGMKGAARRGTCLGKLSLGFTRRVHRDENGNVVSRPDGRPRKEPCIDPVTKEHRVLLYELFTQKGWSPYKITRHFNKLKVDGWDGWTERAIKQLLWNPNAIGMFIWNKTRREYDWDEGKWVVVKNPRSEWEVYHDPKLAIVPRKMWAAARLKLAAMRRKSPLTGRKRSRNQVSATTLFSGTLFCEYCWSHEVGDAEIKLIRSTPTPKYKQMGCLNGTHGAHGCQLSSSKSTKIIEESLLGYLRDVILTDESVTDLLVRANSHLEEEAKKPQVDTAPMKSQARKLENKIKKLVKRVEDEPDEELCAAYDKRIQELQRDIKPLNERIREAERLNRKKDVKPLDLGRAEAYLSDLRGLLNQETPVAAEAIRTLTGPIRIRQEPIPGRKNGARWVATFSPDLLRLLRQLARDKDYPDSVVLANAEAPEPETIELAIEKVPKYERLALVFKQMRDNGASVESIASAHAMSRAYAAEILHFAYTGERPKWKARKRAGTGTRRTTYRDIAEEVADLRDKEKMPFTRIASKYGVSEGTIRRAYDHARPEAVCMAAEQGERPRRGRYSSLGEEVYRKIRELLRTGEKPVDVASEVGCGTSTVHRVQKRMREETGDGRAA